MVAAGAGARFGHPKQYSALAGKRVLDWAVAAATTTTDGIVLVVPPERVEDLELVADVVVAGGTTRAASVRAGLAAVPPSAGVVVVHDAARPLASPLLFLAVMEAVRQGADGAVPAVEVADTIKAVTPEGLVTATLDRDGLVAVQTPQAFSAATLRAAHAGEPEGTDDAVLVERRGGRVVTVPGEAANRKLTHPSDLLAARAWLSLPPPEVG